MFRDQPFIRKAYFPLRRHGAKGLGKWRKKKKARTCTDTGETCFKLRSAQKGPQHQLHGEGSGEGV